jgi:flagellar biosynthesis/type III secretory pathway M-ring protein FliF/YscJ
MTEALVFGLLALVAVIGVAVLLRRRPSRPAPTPQSPPPASAEADRPDSGRIKGRVRASSKRTVGGIVERHPDEAVSVLRRWIKSGGQADDR